VEEKYEIRILKKQVEIATKNLERMFKQEIDACKKFYSIHQSTIWQDAFLGGE